jgi:predicted 3-demethylubiquinone-9 3-methyltransferase (glyoxalase superfamily)
MTLHAFLTMPETAEPAMNFYTEVFTDTKINRIERIPAGMPYTPEHMTGKVLNGELSLQGEIIYFMDMDTEQAPELSWGVSLYVDFETETEFDQAFDALSENGNVMMGPEPVANFRKVAWVVDKFGVTWQLVWA